MDGVQPASVRLVPRFVHKASLYGGATNRAAQNRSDLCRFRRRPSSCRRCALQGVRRAGAALGCTDGLHPGSACADRHHPKDNGTPSQEIYNILLRHGWTAGSDHMIRAMHLLIRAFHSRQVRVLAEYWSA